MSEHLSSEARGVSGESDINIKRVASFFRCVVMLSLSPKAGAEKMVAEQRSNNPGVRRFSAPLALRSRVSPYSRLIIDSLKAIYYSRGADWPGTHQEVYQEETVGRPRISPGWHSLGTFNLPLLVFDRSSIATKQVCVPSFSGLYLLL
jgi:hypothetical protein